jgi:hypothetical protein
MNEYLNRRHVLTAVASVALASPALALRYEDQDFDDILQLAGKSLVLNGVGEKAGKLFRAYSAALYLGSKASTVDAVTSMSGPKRLQLRILLVVSKSIPIGPSSVDAEELVKPVIKGVGRNCTEAEQAALGERFTQFTQNMRAVGKVRKHDIINIDFVPGTGTTVTINGKQWGPAVPGADLYSAFLKTFVGELPFDRKLKAGLLGLPA